jgi:hypothetical protein
MAVDDPELARRIREDYYAFLNAETRDRVRPLVIELEQQGFTVTAYEGMPSFTVSLPKRVILELNGRKDVGTIYLIGEEERPSVSEVTFLPDACRSEETRLPFETIEQEEWGGTGQAYEAREPNLMVITRLEEIGELAEWVTGEARNHLQTLDYEAYFALIVFQGWKPTDSYGVQINCMTRQDDTVNVYTRFQEPGSGEGGSDTVTSPYHLIQVQKMGAWEQDITFNLVADEAEMSSFSYFIP